MVLSQVYGENIVDCVHYHYHHHHYFHCCHGIDYSCSNKCGNASASTFSDNANANANDHDNSNADKLPNTS